MRTAIFGLCKSLVILTAIATSNQAFAQSPAARARADEIIKLARQAIGDQSKLDSLQSLSLSGTTRRTFGERQTESEIEYEMIFPDKFIRTDNSQLGTTTFALNGNQVWVDFAPSQVGGFGPPGGGGGGRVMRFDGPGPGNSNDPAAQERRSNSQRAEFARMLLGMLLISPSSFQVEFSYLGEAKSPDGTVADAILAKGPGDFKLALYFDQQSHKLLMMNYKARQQLFQMRRGAGGGPGGPDGGRGGRTGGQGAPGAGQGAVQPGQGEQRPQMTGPGRPDGGQGGRPGGQGAPGGGQGQPGQGEQRPQPTPEEREKFLKEMETRMANAPEVEYRWIFEDYKNVGGINLPHRLTKSEAGKPNEELVISKYKINPKLSPDKFVKKETEKTQEAK